MTQEPVPGSDEGQIEQPFDALVGFTGCLASAVPDVCSYGLTIGAQYVPFDPDPEDDCGDEEVQCSQLWVRVTDVTPIHQVEAFGGDCGAVLRIGLEVGILRCLEIPEGGNAPTATDVLVAAGQSMADMNAIYCAAMQCEVWDSISSGSWNPNGPMGGQYGGIWTFTAEL